MGDPAGFAPDDPTDHRGLLDWRSKYPAEAQRAIRNEAIYLGLLLALAPIGFLVLWLALPQRLGIPGDKYPAITRYGLAWIAGMLGGTLFDVKWLYHSVARQLWHEDRHLWRVFTPHLSGGLAFAVTALLSSGLLRIFDSTALSSPAMNVGVAFLIGYFSDSAVAKLSEIAETLFGGTRAKTKRNL